MKKVTETILLNKPQKGCSYVASFLPSKARLRFIAAVGLFLLQNLPIAIFKEIKNRRIIK